MEPFGTPVVVTVNTTDEPSLAESVDGVSVKVGTTLLTVIVELVATTVPEVDWVLTTKLNVSEDSKDKSFNKLLVTVAIPVVAPVPTIRKEPVRDPSEKSAVDTFPSVL